MTDVHDPLEKARLRQLKRQLEHEQAAQREKDNAARIRVLERERATREATLLGRSIRSLHGSMSAAERQMLAGILKRVPDADRPADWYKIERFTKPDLSCDLSRTVPDAAATPAPESDDLGHYRPTRSDAGRPDEIAAE